MSRTPPTSGSTLDADLFRKACSRYATGIAVATVIGPDSLPTGMTINSFTSVSCCPPLVLICVDYRAALLPYFRASSYYGVNVLEAAQQDLSRRFSRRLPDHFEGLDWYPGSHGVPLLKNCLASVECAVDQVVEAGDHAIFIAEALHAEHRDGSPLLYFGSSYRTLA